jgi:hypothetical protein
VKEHFETRILESFDPVTQKSYRGSPAIIHTHELEGNIRTPYAPTIHHWKQMLTESKLARTNNS